MNKMIVSGKRKTSVAKATIEDGSGKVLINKKPVTFLPDLQQLEIQEPLMIAKDVLGKLDFDISINVTGGGNASRVEASRLAIAKAIVKFTKNEDLKQAYLVYDRNLLVADTRRKEAYKPGDSKARSMRQSSKR
jgi:small subunit ribosomal protein S9